MPLHPGWEDIGLRLLLTVIAGAMIGLNREMHGHSAGLRTTLLVGLAACVAMIQANLLLSVAGRTADSFVSLDILRFPLGILTGVGFIGGGAILRRGNFVTGVTTAATIWVMTAIGLCFGGGQLGIGLAATAIAFITLWFMKWAERHIPREQRALLSILVAKHDPLPDLSAVPGTNGYRARFVSRNPYSEAAKDVVSYDIRWRNPDWHQPPAALLEAIGKRFPVIGFKMADEAE
jgi:putative Mg2+ transporter-C (MgtC) family protein